MCNRTMDFKIGRIKRNSLDINLKSRDLLENKFESLRTILQKKKNGFDIESHVYLI